jgi:short-subunit dehydrogenase
MIRAVRIASLPCLVTGASAGIGAEVALALARRRCAVALLARRQEQLLAVARQVEGVGGKALVVVADVTDAEALQRAVAQAAEKLGGLRLVVANAGVGVHAAAEELPHAELERVFQVNCLGAMATVRTAVPYLLASAPAAIVAVSSLSGLIPYRGGSAYGASKAALNQYLRCLRLELGGRGVRVGWLCPGPVATDLILEGVPHRKLPRLARLLVPVLSPARVAAAVIRLAERGGGERVMPWSAALFAWMARCFPVTAERLERLTGAGEV